MTVDQLREALTELQEEAEVRVSVDGKAFVVCSVEYVSRYVEDDEGLIERVDDEVNLGVRPA